MEIGGFFEMEKFFGAEYHSGLTALNSGRNALRYLIKQHSIKRIYMPYYMCDSVTELCGQENVTLHFYPIDRSFRPVLSDEVKGEWLYVSDFYGFMTEDELLSYNRFTDKLIIDCTHSFYKKFPLCGVNVIYSCRKFFGVSDGAYLQCSPENVLALERDRSGKRLLHLVGRMEENAGAYYSEYRKVEEEFSDMPLMKMSEFTQNVMRGIDYEKCAKKRTENYEYLSGRLDKHNLIQQKPVGVPFSYPLLCEKGVELRKHLIGRGIFVPTLWANVCEMFPNQPEAKLALKLCSLPIDQRYSYSDMEYIANRIDEFIEEN